MSEYQNSIVIQAHPDKVFDFVADINNLPSYLPTVHNASLVSQERIRVQGEAGGHKYDDEGYFRADQETRKLEWGSDGESDYSGWLKVDQGEEPSAARITVHIAFAMSPEQQQKFAASGGNRDAMMQEGISKTLQSIKNLCEGQGGKVESQAAASPKGK
jgi:uncharacterized protein YndB with AHSA1/START domain